MQCFLIVVKKLLSMQGCHNFCDIYARLQVVHHCSTTFNPSPGELPGFWSSVVLCHAPLYWKESGNNNNNMELQEWQDCLMDQLDGWKNI